MKFGIERLAELDRNQIKAWGNCALLCNQASLTSDFSPSWWVLKELIGDRLKALLSPQHGFDAVVQDNMLETGHCTHRETNLPIFSLYSETREPTQQMLSSVDTIVVDLQIVGCRVYTFKYTVAACLRAAKKYDKSVIVLDRPNPLGGVQIEGPVLDLSCKSFVGEFEIPMRHGLSVGEAAELFNRGIGARLEILEVSDWSGSQYLYKMRNNWVLTSPNLPTHESVLAYPGTVVFEGTNISEGRGTTMPFTLIGAPFLESRSFVARTLELFGEPRGFFLRPASFSPTSQKWKDEVCHGCQIIITDPEKFLSFRLGIALLRASIELGGDNFHWKTPPYEYDYETLPIKLILGDEDVADILTATSFDLNSGFWTRGCDGYREKVRNQLKYSRNMLI